MNKKEVHLYRIKFIKPTQVPLFARSLTPKQILLSAIAEKPSKIIENGTGWTIGNVVSEDEYTGSFAIGRITTKSVEKYDKKTGDFVDEVDETGPYTLAFYDATIGLLGILKKSNVSATPSSISSRIKELFETTEVVINSEVEVNISYIPDPDDFIIKLRSAYSIRKFRASFTGPNPVDADEFFQKPLSVYCQTMDANAGAVEVLGNDINAEAAEAVARSTAATANTASATIIESHGAKSRRIHLKKGALIAQVDPEAGRKDILDELKSEYMRVRS